MNYPRSQKYHTPEILARIMGPNPLKLQEELLEGVDLPAGSRVCDLGSGQGVTSLFLAKEYGVAVYAVDLWSAPDENRAFFRSQNVPDSQIIPVAADARMLPFPTAFFDAVVSTDSYNYFGRDPDYLDQCLLPCVKPGGLICIAVPGMKRDLHECLPPELLLSWTPEQLDYLHDADYWRRMVSASQNADVVDVSPMQSNEEVWADWLQQDNDYARGDQRAMEAGAGQYLNFVRIVLRRK